jgi:hypothetical protein
MVIWLLNLYFVRPFLLYYSSTRINRFAIVVQL